MQETALQKLAGEAASGNMDALEDLIRGIYDNLFNLLHLLNIPQKDLEDVAQDVVVQMHRSLPSYQTDQPFLPWLRTIGRRVASNYWRSHLREAKWKTVFREYVERRVIEEKGENVSLSRLGECVKRLQEKQREIVDLRYSQGLNSSRIAQMLQLSDSRVRQLLARIRHTLRVCIEASAHQ